MRRFIYLDTDTLNSYIAQIYGGIVTDQKIEHRNIENTETKNTLSGEIEGGVDFSLFGKGINAKAQTAGEDLKTVANSSVIGDIQTKIMHDNAFDWLVKHAQENNLITTNNEIGRFILVKDEFYIFDMAFYQKLVDEGGLMDLAIDMTEINAEQQHLDEAAKLKQGKNIERTARELAKKDVLKQRKAVISLKKLFAILKTILPYPQMLCIQNYAVVLNAMHSELCRSSE